MQIEGADAHNSSAPGTPLGQRIQRFLRQRYGRDAAKRVAAITQADLRTARGWVEEAREPKGQALLAIIKEMGRDGLLALFSPEVEAHEEKIQRQVDELKREAARLEARLGKGGSQAADQVADAARFASPGTGRTGDQHG